MTDASREGPPPPPAVRVRNLWHSYGSLEVLRDVTFEVAHGEIFGFIGPNGAGKTTAIRILATLLEPLAGQVEIDGLDVRIDRDEIRRRIGYMPDHAGVYERITIREYLEFFSAAYGKVNLGVVDAVLELTGLMSLQGRLVATLSKGMRQRLQLCRTLLHDPSLLILDEPASDLDARARIEVRDLLLELRDLGKTIFLSSHILSELSDICSSVGILERGRLLAAGPVQEIADRLREGSSAATAAARAAPSCPTGAATGESPEPARDGDPVRPSPEAAPRRLVLRVLGDPKRVVPLLAGGGGVRSVRAGANGRVTVEYSGDHRFVAEVVRYLVGQGIDLIAVEPELTNLEDIFLEITRGEVQ